jgi:hypothetical protein
MALQPFELNALPRHLFALLAHLFALARTEGVEEILEVPVAAVLPVKLTAHALQPARLQRQRTSANASVKLIWALESPSISR